MGSRLTARYQREWQAEKRAGAPTRLVLSSPAVAWVLYLQSAGASGKAIARAADVSPQYLSLLVRNARPGAKTGRDKAARIRAVTLDQVVSPDRWVPAFGARRRIQALLVMGHTQARQRRACGVDVNKLLSHPGVLVERTTAAKVATMYRTLTRTPGTSKTCASMALAWGYAGPGAWDDIDDPTEVPTPEQGRTTLHRKDLIEEATILADDGQPLEAAAARLGITEDAVARQLRRAGRHDLLRWLRRNGHDRRAA